MVLGLFLGGDEFLPRFYSFSRLQLQEIGPFIDENWSLFNGLLLCPCGQPRNAIK
jgi:hypothetical protein